MNEREMMGKKKWIYRLIRDQQPDVFKRILKKGMSKRKKIYKKLC